jgi:hypothetical protein
VYTIYVFIDLGIEALKPYASVMMSCVQQAEKLCARWHSAAGLRAYYQETVRLACLLIE